VAGAIVEVRAQLGSDIRLVASGTPSQTGDGVLRLAYNLVEGELLLARQRRGASASDDSPLGQRLEVLGANPGDAGALSLVSHPAREAELVVIEGAYPGARVRLRDTTRGYQVTRGVVEALGSVAELAFRPGLNLDSSLDVFQEWALSSGPETPIGKLGAGGATTPLAVLPPRIVGPVGAGASAITVAGLAVGARVTLEHRRPGQLLGAIVERRASAVRVDWALASLALALEVGDSLAVRQTLGASTSAWTAITVERAFAERPWLVAPGADTGLLVVAGLQPFAEVELRIRRAGSERAYLSAAYAACSVIAVDPAELPPGATVQVRHAGASGGAGPGAGPGAWSQEVELRTAPPLAPRLAHPLYEGMARVCVQGVYAGALVRVVSGARASPQASGVIGESVATGVVVWDAVEVHVPALKSGDTLWVEATQAGRVARSPSATVRPRVLYPFPAPSPIAGLTVGPLRFDSVVPGAAVEVFVGERLAAAPVVATGTEVQLPPPAWLRAGSSLSARQRVGARVSARALGGEIREGALAVVAEAPVDAGPAVAREARKLTGASSMNSTLERYRLPGMDLGVPVEHQGKLVLFFGDSRQYDREVPPKPTTPFLRPIAVVSDLPEDPDVGLGLGFLVDERDALCTLLIKDEDNVDPVKGRAPIPVVLHRAAGLPEQLDTVGHSFDVPTGAFSYDGQVHVFVMRKVGYKALTPKLGEKPGDVADRWQRGNFAANDNEGFLGVVGGRSVLASGRDPGCAAFPAVEVCDIRNFDSDAALDTAWKFSQVCPLVVDGATIPALGVSGDVLLLWGTGAYRQSDVCFAWTPLRHGEPIPRANEWRYFTGGDATAPLFVRGHMPAAVGLLRWSDTGEASPIANYPNVKGTLRPEVKPFVANGEFSVIYLELFQAWLLLHPGDGDVRARVARTPWGPWTPVGLAGARGGAVVLSGVGGRYAPYALARYTHWDTERRGLRIYFLLSSLFKDGDPHGEVSLYTALLGAVEVEGATPPPRRAGDHTRPRRGVV